METQKILLDGTKQISEYFDLKNAENQNELKLSMFTFLVSKKEFTDIDSLIKQVKNEIETDIYHHNGNEFQIIEYSDEIRVKLVVGIKKNIKKSEEIIGSSQILVTETQKNQIETITDKFNELVDLLDSFEGCGRRKAITFTNLETAKMYAVKAITHK